MESFQPAVENPKSVPTHYAVLTYIGDPGAEHPVPELNGAPPFLALIAAGSEDFCWETLAKWTARCPPRTGEAAEVLARHPSVVHPAGT